MSIADRREVRNERVLDVRQLKQRKSPLQMGAYDQPLERKWTAQPLAQSQESENLIAEKTSDTMC